MYRLFLLMLLLTLGLTQSVQAQSDTNGDPDIFLPGTASKGGNYSGSGVYGYMNQAAANMGIDAGMVLYTLENSIQIGNLLNALLPVGLEIHSHKGTVAFTNDASIESHLPDQILLPEVSMLPMDKGSAKLFTSFDRVVATGSFVINASLKELKAKSVELTLTKNEQTTCGQVCVCLGGDLESTTAAELEQWIENGLSGTTCQMFNNGELDLDFVLLSAFDAHPELDTIGIMQTGMNAASQEVTQKTCIIARKVIDEVSHDSVIRLEVKTETE